MKYLLILLILNFTFYLVKAQSNYVKKADSYYSFLKYKEAIDNYKEALKFKEVNESYIQKQISKAYYALKNYKEAKVWYDKYFSLPHESDPKVTLEYANLLRNYELYDSALIMYQKYGLESKEEVNLNVFEELCDFPYAKNSRGICKAKIELTTLDVGIDNMGVGFLNEGVIYSKPVKKRELDRTVYYDLTTARTSDSLNFEEVKLFSKKMNAIYYDGAPFLYNEETKLIFTRNQEVVKSFNTNSKKNVFKESEGLNLLQLFYASSFERDKWSSPNLIVFEKQNYNYAFPYVDTVNELLYFSSDLSGGYGGFDIYTVKFKDGEVLSNPLNLGPAINTFDNDIYPFLCNDKLFYASKGKPGLGGYDLFMATVLDSNLFEESVNLGRQINTSFDDFNLILDSSKQGYFASNRANQNGNDKIYKVKLIFEEVFEGLITNLATNESVFNVIIRIYEEYNGNWIEKKSFDTKDSERYQVELDPSKKSLIVYDHPEYFNDTLFFNPSSTEDDLNRSLIKVKKLKGKVVDAITRQPIPEAGVVILSEGKIVENTVTDSAGVWSFMPEKNKNYTVRVNEDNYEGLEIEIPEINELNYEMIELDIDVMEMSPVARVGNILKIDNIYFDFNKSNIKEESLGIMDNIYNYLVVHSKIKIELSAHTDCVGKDSYNLKLSSDRAQSCYDYLIGKGIKSGRIIPKGYGEQKMVAPDCRRQRKDKDYAQKNRRVEVKILN